MTPGPNSPNPSPMTRLDGLTPQVMQTPRGTWWDNAFTRHLLRLLPDKPRKLVELQCGTGASARYLLPRLPGTTYLGVESSPERLAEARHCLDRSRLADRVDTLLAHPQTVPLDDGACDAVLTVLALQRVHDVPAVLSEARRLLEPGGHLVTAEPDNLGQRFYFDGVLEEVNRTFHAVCLRARVARQPADIAVGPRMPALMRDAQMLKLRVVLHTVHATRMESAAAFCGRLERVTLAVAREADLGPDDAPVADCLAAIQRCLFAGLPKRVGFSGHLVPLFLCRGIRP